MRQPKERYPGGAELAAIRSQAVRVWLVACAVWLVFVGFLLAPAFSNYFGAYGASAALMNAFGYICHQIPDRSFHVFAHPIGVCSRCLGVYVGVLVGFGAYPLWRNLVNVEPPARRWLFLATVPLAVDFSLTFFGIWENTHLTRLLSGLILGFACGTYIIPAIVEVTRNFRTPSAGPY